MSEPRYCVIFGDTVAVWCDSMAEALNYASDLRTDEYDIHKGGLREAIRVAVLLGDDATYSQGV